MTLAATTTATRNDTRGGLTCDAVSTAGVGGWTETRNGSFDGTVTRGGGTGLVVTDGPPTKAALEVGLGEFPDQKDEVERDNESEM